MCSFFICLSQFSALTCLCQAALGSVSISDRMWEREVETSHPGGVGGVGGLSGPVIELRFRSS